MKYFLSVIMLWTFFGTSDAQADELDAIRLPKGFHIAYFAKEVPGARSMALGDKGTLFVGSRDEGNVYAVVDSDGDKKAERVVVLAKGLKMPNGVAFRNGSLYVAEIHRVIRFDTIEDRLSDPPAPVVVNDSFPHEVHHGWKYLRFGPDDKLYVPVGAPCNVCESKPVYAALHRMNADGSGLELYASGIRNTVGFDWEPETDTLWFTDNGRDNLGDNVPPDELNRAPKAGMNFGFPYCHGGTIQDPDFDKHACAEFTPPAQNLGPHVAALGLRFYTGNMFPAEYKNQPFIAEHGSWNRSSPLGYRITRVRVQDGKASDYSVFAEGWLKDGDAWGRPVDLLVLPDGSLLVSDDRSGSIYRIRYEEVKPTK